MGLIRNIEYKNGKVKSFILEESDFRDFNKLIFDRRAGMTIDNHEPKTERQISKLIGNKKYDIFHEGEKLFTDSLNVVDGKMLTIGKDTDFDVYQKLAEQDWNNVDPHSSISKNDITSALGSKLKFTRDIEEPTNKPETEPTKPTENNEDSGSLPPGATEKFLNLTNNRKLLIAGSIIIGYMVVKK